MPLYLSLLFHSPDFMGGSHKRIENTLLMDLVLSPL